MTLSVKQIKSKIKSDVTVLLKNVRKIHSPKIKFTKRSLLMLSSITVAALSFIFCILLFIFCIDYTIIYDGQIIGSVHAKDTALTIENSINTEYYPYSKHAVITKEPGVYPKFKESHEKYISNRELEKIMLESCDELVYSFILRIDGKDFAACENKEELQNAYAQYKAQFSETESENCQTMEKVEFVQDYAYLNLLKTGEDIFQMLNKNTVKKIVISASEFSDEAEILRRFDMDKKDFEALNPNYKPSDKDAEITVTITSSVISFRTTTTETIRKTHFYNTQTVENAKVFSGVTRIAQEGQCASDITVNENISINGKLIGTRRLLHTHKDSVDRIIEIGTLPGNGLFVNGGCMMRPASGVISSYFGKRNESYHQGIDIAGSEGDPIVAAMDGTVLYAGVASGYGNLVILNHGNGYTTYYAHNNELKVQEGQSVSAGDVIAIEGSTGHSTGPHCHFEVRLNNIPQDPLDYIGG